MVCLQETHFSTHSTSKFFGKQYPQVYTASGSTKQRGVLVAFQHTTPLHTRQRPEIQKDAILFSLLLDSETTIVSYYAPNKKPLSFLSHLLSVIASHTRGTLRMCGDSNQVIYPLLDKSLAPTTAQRITYQQLLNQYSLLDSWREQNPAKWQNIHYSHPHKQFSHIDHILVSVGTSLLILTSDIVPCA